MNICGKIATFAKPQTVIPHRINGRTIANTSIWINRISFVRKLNNFDISNGLPVYPYEFQEIVYVEKICYDCNSIPKFNLNNFIFNLAEMAIQIWLYVWAIKYSYLNSINYPTFTNFVIS